MYIYICTYVCTYTYINIHIYVYIYMCIYLHLMQSHTFLLKDLSEFADGV